MSRKKITTSFALSTEVLIGIERVSRDSDISRSTLVDAALRCFLEEFENGKKTITQRNNTEVQHVS